jgi:Zn-dependent peptidase ImmA (M78 family)
MDEVQATAAARSFIAGLDLSNLHDSLDVYLAKVNAKVKFEDLGQDESGYTVPIIGSPRIVVNSNEPASRQRFTICHEIAHLALGLQSNHGDIPLSAYAKRDPNESACDVFAAELLMPYFLFKPHVPDTPPTFELLEDLAQRFGASFPAAASRFASICDEPCALVACESGRVRYTVRSASLRALGGWIDVKGPIPPGSISQQLRLEKESGRDSGEVAQDIWFSDWPQGCDLTEHARYYAKRDETIALLWFESEDGPPERALEKHSPRSEENELTGELPWPGKSRKKR